MVLACHPLNLQPTMLPFLSKFDPQTDGSKHLPIIGHGPTKILVSDQGLMRGIDNWN